MNWYVAFLAGDAENVYEKYEDDMEAVTCLKDWEDRERNEAEPPTILEIWRCKDDECLSPEEMVWPMRDKLIPVCIYCDSTGLYTQEECESDNLTELDFPEWIVRKWFDENIAPAFPETTETGSQRITFDEWYEDLYTADDTDGLYDFAYHHGFAAKRPDIQYDIFRTEVYELLKSVITKDYAAALCDSYEFLNAVKSDVEETSAWADEGYYNDADIKLALGRVICSKFHTC